MIVLSKQGHLIYVSENVINYLGLPAVSRYKKGFNRRLYLYIFF